MKEEIQGETSVAVIPVAHTSPPHLQPGETGTPLNPGLAKLDAPQLNMQIQRPSRVFFTVTLDKQQQSGR